MNKLKPQTAPTKPRSSCALSLAQWISHNGLVGFVYHIVSTCQSDYHKHLIHAKTPDTFRRDMHFLRDFAQPIACDEVAAVSKGRIKPQKRAVHVSFDDGYQQCFSDARPILLQLGIPCTFFVTTGFMDNQMLFYRNAASLIACQIHSEVAEDRLAKIKMFVAPLQPRAHTKSAWIKAVLSSSSQQIERLIEKLEMEPRSLLEKYKPYLTRDQVRQMSNEGFTIGAHSLDHSQLQLLSGEKEIERQIVESCQIVAELTDRPSVPFAIPFGGKGISRELLHRIVQRNEVLSMIFDTRGLRRDAPFVANRIGADCIRTPPVSGTDLPHRIRKACIAGLADQWQTLCCGLSNV